MQKEKEKKIFSNSHQQVVFSHLLESKASIHEAVAPKDRCFHNYLPLFSFYSPSTQLLMLIWHHMVWHIPLVGLGQPLLISCPSPAYWPWARGEVETALMVGECCLANSQNTGAVQCCYSYKCKAQHYKGCCGESWFHPSERKYSGTISIYLLSTLHIWLPESSISACDIWHYAKRMAVILNKEGGFTYSLCHAQTFRVISDGEKHTCIPGHSWVCCLLSCCHLCDYIFKKRERRSRNKMKKERPEETAGSEKEVLHDKVDNWTILQHRKDPCQSKWIFLEELLPMENPCPNQMVWTGVAEKNCCVLTINHPSIP